MNLINKGFYIFDECFPIHTWYPILDGTKEDITFHKALKQLDTSQIQKRALYFHIPFCQNQICTFCSFPRKLCDDYNEIEEYVQCLVKEIEIKSKFESISGIPIHSIFFGGGTPSVLNPSQIRRIGEAIHSNFNLSNLKEWSFENNIQSVSEEKVIALKEIGVTHVRAGVQTLNPKYRKLFNLVLTVEEVKAKINILKKHFDNVAIDIIYAINGQTLEELIKDIHEACLLDVKLIDFYPLTQPNGGMKLKKAFESLGMLPKTEIEIMSFMTVLQETLKTYGYVKHNTHGFVKNEHSDYVFEYHKCTMGNADGDVIGFGSGAWSKSYNYCFENFADINAYIEHLQNDDLPMNIYSVNTELFYSKPISSHLPYFGYVFKKDIIESKVDISCLKSIQILLDEKLLIENEIAYILVEKMWVWNSTLAYYLAPIRDKRFLNECIKTVDKKLYKYDLKGIVYE